jgi:hypothetical protein
MAASTYHYRIVAVNGTGTTVGRDRTFATKRIPLSLAISQPLGRVVFGSPFIVSGVLSGTGSAYHEVLLEGGGFPFPSDFSSLVAPELTDGAGYFAFRVAALAETTRLRVVTGDDPPVRSPTVVQLVAVRVSLHLHRSPRRGSLLFYGTVEPAQARAVVSFQLLRPGREPLTVARTRVRRDDARRSVFGRAVRVRRGGLYRAFVQVSDRRQASNQSRSVRIR